MSPFLILTLLYYNGWRFLNFLIRDDDGNISLTMLLTASELKHNVRCGVSSDVYNPDNLTTGELVSE